MKHGLLLLALIPVVSGCATRYCERSEQVYETTAEQAPLESPEGLRVPPPDPNFAIPEATGEDVKYSTPGTDSAGRARSTCLDTPPTISVVAPPAKPETAVEPAPELPAESPDQPTKSGPAGS